MPSLKKTEKPAAYSDMDTISKSFGEKRDCAVIAVASACDVSYEVAHEALRKAGRRAGCGTFMASTHEAIESLGFKFRYWTSAEMVAKVQSYPIKAAGITTHHPRRLPKCWAGTGTLLFRSRGHILCVKDGVVLDWSINNSLRVIDVIEVEKA